MTGASECSCGQCGVAALSRGYWTVCLDFDKLGSVIRFKTVIQWDEKFSESLFLDSVMRMLQRLSLADSSNGAFPRSSLARRLDISAAVLWRLRGTASGPEVEMKLLKYWKNQELNAMNLRLYQESLFLKLI